MKKLLTAIAFFGLCLSLHAQVPTAPRLPVSVPVDGKVVFPITYKGLQYSVSGDRIGSGSTGNFVTYDTLNKLIIPGSMSFDGTGMPETRRFYLTGTQVGIPYWVFITPLSEDTPSDFYITNKTASYFDIVFREPCPVGSQNINFEVLLIKK